MCSHTKFHNWQIIVMSYCPKCSQPIRLQDSRKSISQTCDALRDLVSCAQFKERERQPWRSVTFSTKSVTSPWVFFTFLKLYKWYQIAQRITNVRNKSSRHGCAWLKMPKLFQDDQQYIQKTRYGQVSFVYWTPVNREFF